MHKRAVVNPGGEAHLVQLFLAASLLPGTKEMLSVWEMCKGSWWGRLHGGEVLTDKQEFSQKNREEHSKPRGSTPAW